MNGVYPQWISGNSSTDTVQIEFFLPDGTAVTSLTDFRMQSQMTRIFVVGEEELGEPGFQAICFVSSYDRNGDLIPPEAVMKLRQKNPRTVRVADEDRGESVRDADRLLIANSPIRMAAVSSHLSSFCKYVRVLPRTLKMHWPQFSSFGP